MLRFRYPLFTVLAAGILLAGCDAVDSGDAASPASLATAPLVSTPAELGTTSYLTGPSQVLNVHYTVTNRLTSSKSAQAAHTVSFLDATAQPVVVYRYVAQAKGVGVRASWPGVAATQATLTIFNGSAVVYEGTVSAVGGEANLGDSSETGRSIHVKPGEVSIDNHPITGDRATCSPPDAKSVPCTDYRLTFNAPMPTVHTARVSFGAETAFRELSAQVY